MLTTRKKFYFTSTLLIVFMHLFVSPVFADENLSGSKLLQQAINLRDTGQERQAIEKFLVAADSRGADKKRCLTLAGLLQWKIGKKADSLKTFQKLVLTEPDYPEGYIYLARTYLNLNDRKNAIAVVRYGAKRINSSERFFNALGDYVALMTHRGPRGKQFINTRKERAKILLSEALRTELSLEMCGIFIDLCVRLGGQIEALQAADLAITKYPERYEFLKSKAYVLSGLNRFEEETQILEKYLDKYPEDRECRALLLTAYWRQGNCAPVFAKFEKYLAINDWEIIVPCLNCARLEKEQPKIEMALKEIEKLVRNTDDSGILKKIISYCYERHYYHQTILAVRKCLQVSPACDHTDLEIILCRSRLYSRHTAECIDETENIIRRIENDNGSTSHLGKFYLVLAEAYANQKNPLKAQKYLQLASARKNSLQPEDIGLLTHLSKRMNNLNKQSP